MDGLVLLTGFLLSGLLVLLALDWGLHALFSDEQIDRFAERVFRQ